MLFVTCRLSWMSLELSGQTGHMMCECCWGVRWQIMMWQPRIRRGNTGRWLRQHMVGFFRDPVVIMCYLFTHGWGIGGLAVLNCMAMCMALVALLGGCSGAMLVICNAGSSSSWWNRDGMNRGMLSALGKLFLLVYDGFGQSCNKTYECEANLDDIRKRGSGLRLDQVCLKLPEATWDFQRPKDLKTPSCS